jgi:hypothetical protein
MPTKHSRHSASGMAGAQSPKSEHHLVEGRVSRTASLRGTLDEQNDDDDRNRTCIERYLEVAGAEGSGPGRSLSPGQTACFAAPANTCATAGKSANAKDGATYETAPRMTGVPNTHAAKGTAGNTEAAANPIASTRPGASPTSAASRQAPRWKRTADESCSTSVLAFGTGGSPRLLAELSDGRVLATRRS